MRLKLLRDKGLFKPEGFYGIMKLLIITVPLFSSFSIFLFGRFIGKQGSTIIAFTSILISTLISIYNINKYISYGLISKISVLE